jgi:MFS family permease
MARVVQGAGGAMLMPVGRLAVLRTFPRSEFLAALSFASIPGMIGPMIGPTLGGWLTQTLSWHWIFLINIPVGLIGALAATYYMPNSTLSPLRRFDASGYAMLGIAMVGITFALDGLSNFGFQHATVLLLLIASFAALSTYILHAGRAEQPLFPISLFRIHTFKVGLLGNLFTRIGNTSMPFMIPLTLQICLGYTPLQAGLMMLPASISGMFAKRLGTRLIQQHGYRNVLLINTLSLGVIMAAFALLSPHWPFWIAIVQLLLYGIFSSIQFTAMNTITLQDLEAETASSGNSLLSMVQMLSMSLAVTVAGALLATFHQFFDKLGKLQPLPAFQVTFICIGVMTAASAWIFTQLTSESYSSQIDAPSHFDEA